MIISAAFSLGFLIGLGFGLAIYIWLEDDLGSELTDAVREAELIIGHNGRRAA